MRLPYVLILLAVATRPVDVGAHADPSDIVTTDGRFEVQRHLRVQEHTPGKDNDNDERTFPSVEEIVSPNAIDKAANMLDLTFLDYDHGGASNNAMSNLIGRKRQADETLESASKKIKEEFTLEEELLADMYWAELHKMQMIEGENPFGKIISKTTANNRAQMFRSINTRFLKSNATPQQVFAMYYLKPNLAGDKLFRQTQLKYWVDYLSSYNAKLSSKESMYDTIKMYYDAKSLVEAMADAPHSRYSKQVGNEWKDYWITRKVTPVDAFTLLNLKGVDDNSLLASFWVKYFVYYNDHVGINEKVSVALATTLLEQPYLLTLFRLILKSKSTTQLEEEVKNMQLKIWEDEETSDKRVRQTVNAVMSEWTVYGSALRKAFNEHFHGNQ